MNELTKIDYSAPVEELLPVSNKNFPSEEFDYINEYALVDDYLLLKDETNQVKTYIKKRTDIRI